ncbi:eukaryotic translation initiation factor 4 gamma 3-like isoform X2 [Branchiostoma floridae]|uniref:Eukaryotic translation initiation factor 4 gamma 3-like isoform X2 n=1 Tax=Branchiostoma floridae TaxID=7739 RepID=A0A9J7NB13_BRAFL|nr:eukaryotic translation initiation factor 4 gamma 3-like isoform X2 [Branchiostoma floridae]
MATGGESPQGSLQIENFECSICLQVYMRPKVLSCGHTFCKECLVPLAKGSKSFKCPTCQATIRLERAGRAGIEGLIDNISLSNLRDYVETSNRQGPRGSENPTVVSDESQCPKHHGEELRYYCPPCDAAICEECMFEDHNTHGVTRLRRTLQEQSIKAKEVCEEGTRLIETIRHKITELEQSRKRLAVEEGTLVKAVDQTARKLADDFATEVTKRANSLKDELHNLFAPSNSLVLDCKESLEIRLAQLVSSVESLEKSINQGEAIVVFSGRKMLKDLIEQSSQPTKAEQDVETGNIAVFTPTPYSFPAITLGKVQAWLYIAATSKIWERKKETDEEKVETSAAPKEDSPAPEVDGVTNNNEAEENDEDIVEIEDKSGLKYKCREDQRNPLNSEGKKQYDRSFLLQFQPECIDKPDGLPKIVDVVLDKPLIITPQQMQGRPQDFRGMGGSPGIPDPWPIPSYMKSPGGDHRRMLQKPSTMKRGAEKSPEEEVTDEVFEKMQGILDKLTSQNFQTLCQQVLDLDIVTEERLKGVIDLVFEKAITEPNFSVAYANMCRCLIHLKVPMKDNPKQTVNFRKLLLNRCQGEFERDIDNKMEKDERMRKIELAKNEDEKKKMQAELEEEMANASRRSLGNIRFIGELFKLKILAENIMHDCVVKLIKFNDEESLECLCRLLTMIGKDLDVERAKPLMDQYFEQLERNTKQKKTSSRLRFMIQDVLELRRNNWAPP